MSDFTVAYRANAAFTITLASLADAAARQSTEITNSNNDLDALIQGFIKTAAAGVDTAGGAVEVYAFASIDDGTTRDDGAGASDAAITVANARLLCVIKANVNATTFYVPVTSVAGAFGGVLPERWGIIVKNESGAALDATGGSHAINYQGIYAQGS